MASPLLSARGLRVERSGRLVLAVDRLDVRRSEALALIGPNGSGKSTLLLALGLLLTPTAGEVFVDDQTAHTDAERRALRRRMAVVFQEPLLLDRSVYDNVALGLRLRGATGRDIERQVTPWLERLGIAALAKRPARQLSGGEAQRTSLARALVLRPDILLLDEPFSALDAPTRAGLVEQVGEIVRELGAATVFVTHDRDEALALGDRIAVLIRGRLRQVGPPGEVFAAPADVDVAQFVGVETVLAGRVVAQEDGVARVQVGDHLIDAVSPAAAGAAACVCVRPEDVTLLAPATVGVSSARNQFAGRVERVRPVGAQVRVTVDVGFPITALVTRRSAETLALAPGVSIIVAFKATAVHLIPRSMTEPHAQETAHEDQRA